MLNICVIGMPYVGKTYIVNLLCKMYDLIPFYMSSELKKIKNDKKMNELGEYPKKMLDKFIEDNKYLSKGFAIDYLKTSVGINDIEEVFNKHKLSFPIILFINDDNMFNLIKKAIYREIVYQNNQDNNSMDVMRDVMRNVNCTNAHNRIKKYINLQHDINRLSKPWNNFINIDENNIVEQIEHYIGKNTNNINDNLINEENNILLIENKNEIENITNVYFNERKYDNLEFILSIDENKKIINWLGKLIEIKKGDQLFFPGEMVYSMDNKSVERVIYNDYMVSLKLDGVRFLLCNCDNGIYFINRSFDIYKKTTYKKYNHIAIFDGELIKCKYNKYWYIIFDVLYYDGINLQMDVLKKLYLIENIPFYNENCVEDDITIVKKMYYNKFETPSLIKFKSIYPGDGLIFTPSNPSNPTYKWKKIHTFDFRLMKINNVYKLYAYNGHKEVEFVNCIIHKNNKLNLDDYVNKIVECYEHNNRTNNNKRIYEIKNIRTDKNKPNKIQMIVNTTKLSEYDLLKYFRYYEK